MPDKEIPEVAVAEQPGTASAGVAFFLRIDLPAADVAQRSRDVRLVPEADIHGTTHILWITKDGVAPHPVDGAKIG